MKMEGRDITKTEKENERKEELGESRVKIGKRDKK